MPQYAALIYETATRQLWGQFEVDISLQLAWFTFQITIGVVQEQISGPSSASGPIAGNGQPEFRSGGGTFSDFMSRADWNQYIGAYAGTAFA